MVLASSDQIGSQQIHVFVLEVGTIASRKLRNKKMLEYMYVLYT